MAVDRNITVNFKHNLVEVKYDTGEAVFELLDSENGETKTYKVSGSATACGLGSGLILIFFCFFFLLYLT